MVEKLDIRQISDIPSVDWQSVYWVIGLPPGCLIMFTAGSFLPLEVVCTILG